MNSTKKGTSEHLELRINAGLICADVETNTKASSIYLSFCPNGYKQTVDVAAIRDIPGTEGIQLLLFGDLSREDKTAEVILTRDEICAQMQEGGYYRRGEI